MLKRDFLFVQCSDISPLMNRGDTYIKLLNYNSIMLYICVEYSRWVTVYL